MEVTLRKLGSGVQHRSTAEKWGYGEAALRSLAKERFGQEALPQNCVTWFI